VAIRRPRATAQTMPKPQTNPTPAAAIAMGSAGKRHARNRIMPAQMTKRRANGETTSNQGVRRRYPSQRL
jgi:hypothetical protein